MEHGFNQGMIIMNRNVVRVSILVLLVAASVSVAQAMMALPATPANTQATTTKTPGDISSQPCLDALFDFFPGYTEYCHGMKRWHAGHYRAALENFEDAASWADKNAQYTLGLIHFNGHHVPVNHALGLAWLMLSAQRKQPHHFKVVLVSAYLASSPQERARARELFKRMLPRYGDAVAARRAKLRYKHAMQSSVRAWSGGAGTRLCIFGLTSMAAPAIPPKQGSNAHPGDAGDCPATIAVQQTLQKAHDTYFEGLIPKGHVDVGPVKQTSGR